jgi:predicted transcriptional regulator
MKLFTLSHCWAAAHHFAGAALRPPRKALGSGSRHLDKPPVDPYLQAMKTTIELPDVLARKAKLLAAERQTTLRALVIQGLEQVIAEKHITAKDRAKKLFAAMDRTSGITAGKRLSRAESHAR